MWGAVQRDSNLNWMRIKATYVQVVLCMTLETCQNSFISHTILVSSLSVGVYESAKSNFDPLSSLLSISGG